MKRVGVTCKRCGRSFDTYQSSAFCSKECWYESIRGSKRGKYNQARVTAMAQAKRCSMSSRRQPAEQAIEAVLNYGYITNISELARKLFPLKRDLVVDCLQRNEKLQRLHESLPRYPLSIQRLQPSQVEELNLALEDGMPRKSILELGARFGISEYGILSFYSLKGFKPAPYIRGTSCRDTVPEVIFEGLLNELGLQYAKQVVMPGEGRNYFVIDFVVEGLLAVEVQGDYWHGNPAIYRTEDLNSIQLNNMSRDIIKLQRMKEDYSAVAQVWEKELHENSSAVKKLIQEKLELCK